MARATPTRPAFRRASSVRTPTGGSLQPQGLAQPPAKPPVDPDAEYGAQFGDQVLIFTQNLLERYLGFKPVPQALTNELFSLIYPKLLSFEPEIQQSLLAEWMTLSDWRQSDNFIPLTDEIRLFLKAASSIDVKILKRLEEENTALKMRILRLTDDEKSRTITNLESRLAEMTSYLGQTDNEATRNLTAQLDAAQETIRALSTQLRHEQGKNSLLNSASLRQQDAMSKKDAELLASRIENDRISVQIATLKQTIQEKESEILTLEQSLMRAPAAPLEIAIRNYETQGESHFAQLKEAAQIGADTLLQIIKKQARLAKDNLLYATAIKDQERSGSTTIYDIHALPEALDPKGDRDKINSDCRKKIRALESLKSSISPIDAAAAQDLVAAAQNLVTNLNETSANFTKTCAENKRVKGEYDTICKTAHIIKAPPTSVGQAAASALASHELARRS